METTTPIGSYDKGISPYACHDMAGNVYQWTVNQFPSSEIDRTENHAHARYVIRGGAFCEESRYARIPSRGDDPLCDVDPLYSDYDGCYGGRLARS